MKYWWLVGMVYGLILLSKPFIRFLLRKLNKYIKEGTWRKPARRRAWRKPKLAKRLAKRS